MTSPRCFISIWRLIAAIVVVTFSFVAGNVPLFNVDNDKQVLFLPKGTKNGSAIYRLAAWDSEKQFPLTFRVDGQLALADMFGVDSVSDTEANLILLRPLPQSGVMYEVPIIVTDTAGEFTRRLFRINVTDARATPDHVFINYELSYTVSENAPLNTVIGKVTARGDENNSQTVILTIEGSTLFTINPVLVNGKDIVDGEIVLIGALDYETKRCYQLQIEAQNGYEEKTTDTRNVVHLPILVLVTDEQDTPPTFLEAPTVVRIPSDVKAGATITRVLARDGDTVNRRPIEYSLVLEAGSDVQSYFHIDPDDGQLTLVYSASETWDRGGTGLFVIKIKATERGSSPSDPQASSVHEMALMLEPRANVAPAFAQQLYEGAVAEHSVGLVELGGVTSVTDPDQGLAGAFTLSLLDDDDDDRKLALQILEVSPCVVVHAGTFQLHVRNRELLDYESFHELTFKVVARELSATALSSTATVVLRISDINDNVPVFSADPYHVEVAEDVGPGTLIVQVTATDADSGANGEVTYTGLHGDVADKLHLDAATGRITVTADGAFDRETQAEHLLVVEASDGGQPPRRNQTTVRIKVLDVNDNSPQFRKGAYQAVVAPDLPHNEPFLQVEATDADEPGSMNAAVRYEILRGNRGDVFRIDGVSGELFLTKFPEGDQAGNEVSATTTEEPWVLTVRAYDMGIPHRNSTVDVYVHFKGDSSMNGTIQYIFPAAVSDVRRDKERIERFLSKLNGAYTTIERVVPYEGVAAAAIRTRRSVGSERSLVETSVRFHRKSLVDLSAVARELNGSLPSSAADDSNQPIVVEAGVSEGWKVAFIILLVLLVIALLLLFCFCLWRNFRKLDEQRKVYPEEEAKLKTSQVNEVVTAEHTTKSMVPNGNAAIATTEAEPTKRKSQSPHVSYSRHLHHAAGLPVTGVQDAKRRGGGTALDVLEAQMRLGGGDAPDVDDDDDHVGTGSGDYQSSRKQFLEKRSLFTIAYNRNKQEPLKDRDSSANNHTK